MEESRRCDVPLPDEHRDRDQGAARPVRRPGLRPPRARTWSTPWPAARRVAAAERDAMLDMVRLRLRQWSAAVTGPDDSGVELRRPDRPLWPLSGAEPPAWADRARPPRRRRAVARGPGRQRDPVQPPLGRIPRPASTSSPSTGRSTSTTAITSWRRNASSARPGWPPATSPQARRDPRGPPRGVSHRCLSPISWPDMRSAGCHGSTPEAVLRLSTREIAPCRSEVRDSIPRPSHPDHRPARPRLVAAALTSLMLMAPPRRRRSEAPGVRGDVRGRAPARPDLGAGLRDARARPRGQGEPRSGPDWFQPQPFFAVEAAGLEAGRAAPDRRRGGRLPRPARESLEPGRYAVAGGRPAQPRHARARATARGTPTGRSSSRRARPRGRAGPIALEVDRIVPAKAVPRDRPHQARRHRQPAAVGLPRRPIRHRAAVILPEGDATARRATLYIIPGFGGDHGMAQRMIGDRRHEFGQELIRVVLDPDCGTGHHVFADSATNGPRGRALVEELIPHIEATFPAIAEPAARLLNGHSSGGWSSLWLQVTYPDTFGGTWSTSPDPVDFRDFQRIDLYAPGENMFRDRRGTGGRSPGRGRARSSSTTTSRGWRTSSATAASSRSFEAVFSPLGPDGRPRRLWDRATGAVDPEVGQGLGGVRHPPRPGAELAAARPQARRQAPRHHRRARHVLSRRGGEAPQASR